MPEVKAPYNFVPLNKEIFYPKWGPFISHDIPFESGISGSFELNIEAKSPIFIRGEEEPNIQNKALKQYRFPKSKNRYYIPGSSLKGEISSVLEILSFGKLYQINDIKYSQRDFFNEDIYKKTDFGNVLGGWLSRTSNGYKIRYCSTEKPGRINHYKLGTTFSDRYSTGFHGNDKSAKDKYSTFGCITSANPLVTFNNFKFNSILEDEFGKILYEISTNGIKEGTLIFTGQSSRRNDDDPYAPTKRYEFIFWETNKEEYFPDITNENINTEPDPIIKNFLFAYFDHEPKSQSIDWKMWKEHLNQGKEIPIFITITNNKIEHFGLSMLYKLPYKKSVFDIIKESQTKFNENIFDLTECIFGHVTNDKLKGRVQIGHAFSTNDIKEDLALNVTLGSPKASFYPFYIKQDFIDEQLDEIENIFYTYNDGVIAGRKRYPIREGAFNRTEYHVNFPNKTTTTLFPLKEGAKFKCLVNFHNLMPFELGALLSAITFHNQENTFHSIGMGKGIGLGIVLITIDEINISNNYKNFPQDKEEYIAFFEKIMTAKFKNWLSSEQFTELIAMSTPVHDHQKRLANMILRVGGGANVNEYSEIKKNPKKGLRRYTKFMDKNLSANSITSNYEFDEQFETIFEKGFLIFEKKENIKAQIFQIQEKLKEIQNLKDTANENLKNIEIANKKAVENIQNLVNISFDEIIINRTETIAIIKNLENKRANLMVDNELMECQLIIPKEFNKSSLKNGNLIKILITQLSNKRTINQVKLLELL